jgi:hypothetical protein
VALGSSTWRENQKPGRWGWQDRVAPAGALEAYGSQLSVRAGERLDLHVTTRRSLRYRVEVYRLGWYHGAGARRLLCEPSCSGSGRRALRRGIPVADPLTGEVAAKWPVTDRIRTRGNWTSGEYLAQVVIAHGWARGRARWVPFVVRPRHPSRRSILLEVPVNTWEAYNDWGGKSLYDFNSTGGKAAVKVSFDRPWAYDEENARFPVVFEYPMIRFLERSGFSLQYATDIDVDRQPQLLRGHALSVSLGHGEYWSPAIRAGWDAARDAGTNLAFLGANTGYWQARYEDSRHTLVEYRVADLDPDPVGSEKTVRFRSLEPPRPECELEGVQFQGGGLTPPLVGSYTVTGANSPWLRAAGLHPGDVLAGAVVREWDAVQPGCGSVKPTVLFHYAGPDPADATVLSTPAGGRVLALGTEGFGALVDGFGAARCKVDGRAERFLRAAFTDLAQLRPGSLPRLAPACVRRPRARRHP